MTSSNHSTLPLDITSRKRRERSLLSSAIAPPPKPDGDLPPVVQRPAHARGLQGRTSRPLRRQLAASYPLSAALLGLWVERTTGLEPAASLFARRRRRGLYLSAGRGGNSDRRVDLKSSVLRPQHGGRTAALARREEAIAGRPGVTQLPSPHKSEDGRADQAL